MNTIYIRNGVTSIDKLKPFKMYGKKDNIVRYDFHEMTGIINSKLGFDVRGCEQNLKDLGFDIPSNINRLNGLQHCDFWFYQLEAIFRNKVQNDQCNSIYVGTPGFINLKKLKTQPNEWQLFLLNEWNQMFGHLSDKDGWIKVAVWW